MSTAPSIRTCLWFDSDAEAAARAYVALLPGSQIDHIFPQRGDPEGRAFMVQISLMGQKYSLLNGGPHYRLTPAASIEVHLESQAEVDRLWNALLDGGSPSRCGWLTDRWGVSWQIIPRTLMRLMQTEDSARARRVTQAMMAMVKLDGPALEAAAEG
jgi:predicted 3-demethylubiquinone-9 3-methyltransferase (glyoxalase superfamily)